MLPRTSPVGRRHLVRCLVVLLVLSAPVGIAAAESVRGAAGTVVVGADETVGDVEAVAGTIVIRGTVTGDVAGTAGTIHVTESGRVGGSVEAAAGTVRIDGTVDGSVNVGAGSLDVTETARIGGDLDAGAGYASIDGRIGGDVSVGAETVVLGPNARVAGDFEYDAETLTRDPGATVGGAVVENGTRGSASGGSGVLGSVVGAVYELLANLLLGVILLLAFPDFSAGVASRVGAAPLRTGGAGLLTLVGVPLVLLLVAVTLVGLPLAVVGAVAFAGLVWAGLVYGQYAVGVRMLSAVGREHRWLALVVGVGGVAVLGAVPVLGGLLELGVLLLGLGALAVGIRQAYRRHRGGRTERQAAPDEGFEDAPTT
ncbi:bactofilin family protein [Haloplanus pelagicus]|jgi:cytoskeletal protein CcmA (bactofilin family)|uniref:bactofilin family protein n=1 Tax=Haloplanus pelagicus TaxID=2949995 RepID=UPI0020418594|nr:polymer-forming cytoskeletal protein [Haloplanus sp. HW8-1]